MVKLVIVAGPNRGATYTLQSGETSVGRQAGNTIVLASSKVSKKHCTLVSSEDSVEIRDEGSSNGTFINGAAAKAKKLASGDKISVGEYVFEVSVIKPRPTTPVRRPASRANVIPFPKSAGSAGVGIGAPASPSGLTGLDLSRGGGGTQSQIIGVEAGPPEDLFGKLVWYFDRSVMPLFYGVLLRLGWRMTLGGIFAIVSALTVLVTIYPLSSASKNAALRELGKRAKFIAEQVADINSIYLAQKAESKIDLSSIQRVEGLHDTFIIDLDNRILAPSHRAGQNLGASLITPEVVRAMDEYRKGREQGYPARTAGDLAVVVGIAPIKVVDSQHARNQVKALAVVAIETAGSLPSMSESNFIYIEAFFLATLVAVFFFLIAYRITLKPLEVLGDDMDRVLRGDLPQVTKEFKIEELDSLWDRISSALQRVPKNTGVSQGTGSMDFGSSGEDWLAPFRQMLPTVKSGLVLFDGSRTIVAMNNIFEEMSGIKADAAVGQEIGAVARDQAVGQMFNDLFARAACLSDGITEDFEFSGVPITLQVHRLGPAGSSGKAFVVFASKKE